MAATKIQRSFYLTEEQARFIKVSAAQRGVSSSELIGELIETLMAPKTTDPVQIKRQGRNIHDVLSKIAKQ